MKQLAQNYRSGGSPACSMFRFLLVSPAEYWSARCTPLSQLARSS